MKPYYLKDKLYVGISGHKSLKKEKIGVYKNEIVVILNKLVNENPEKEVIMLSSLADGADSLVVHVGKELGFRYEVFLPMPIAQYAMDFNTVSFDNFITLFYEARRSEIVGLCQYCTEKSISDYGKDRDKQYLKVGKKIVDKSDIMLFLWDKEASRGVGGTADIVSYSKQKNKRSIIIECERES